ncbi:uncharacterized protein METZ01_LOCUS228200, partial [marine metagenome]
MSVLKGPSGNKKASAEKMNLRGLDLPVF